VPAACFIFPDHGPKSICLNLALRTPLDEARNFENLEPPHPLPSQNGFNSSDSFIQTMKSNPQAAQYREPESAFSQEAECGLLIRVVKTHRQKSTPQKVIKRKSL
jgi:hypothetical protein